MKTDRLFILSVLLLFATPFSFYVGFIRGEANAYRIVRNETTVNLKIAKEKEDEKLYEYLKARYYYYSNRARLRLRPGEGDFGEVESRLLEGYHAGKDLVTFKSEYEEYQEIKGFSE